MKKTMNLAFNEMLRDALMNYNTLDIENKIPEVSLEQFKNEVRDKIKIKWDNFNIYLDCTSFSDKNISEITPYKFLDFAKQDIKIGDERSYINAITNAKRAIDSQIDWIISYLGYDCFNFNDKKYPYLMDTIIQFEKELDLDNDYSFKLRFIQALEIAQPFLISKIRKTRHELEHEYKSPEKNDVKESIEIAELFIDATRYKLFNKIATDYTISNGLDNEKCFLAPLYIISLESFDEKLELHYRDKNNDCGNVKISSKDREYIFFIKASISHNFYYALQGIDIQIDKKYISYKIIEPY